MNSNIICGYYQYEGYATATVILGTEQAVESYEASKEWNTLPGFQKQELHTPLSDIIADLNTSEASHLITKPHPRGERLFVGSIEKPEHGILIDCDVAHVASLYGFFSTYNGKKS